MLVSNEISKNQYVGDGSATEFAYTFPILDATHIEVYRQLPTETALETKLVPAEEYTVEGAGAESGGKVVFKVAPSSGTKLSILRNVPITQLYQYQELDSFPAESHENALAKLTMICQGMDERLDRAIVVSPTDTVTPDELRNGIFEASEDAIASAAAAASSASAAANSESNAASSASAASNSETAAASSAAAAASSESNAAGSETAAASSASAAANSETAAANSESNAASSASAAAVSDSNAASSAAAAASSESNAAGSAAAAASSASAAAGSETAAAGSESNAASSASAAANSESNAASSASAAANSANAAASSASAAANSEAAAASSAASILELQVEVSTLNPGLPATGEYNPITGILALGIPKGDSGDAAIATPTSLGSVMPQTGDEDGIELETDGKLRVRKASASQRGSVLASATATANAVPQAGADGRLDPSWVYAGLPLGHIFAWPFATAPDGCIILNGSTYDRTLYADFFAYIKSKGWTKTETEWQAIAQANNGFCPWYSEGDGSTNFRTPKFAPYQKIALASGDAGKYYEAGLPNITGNMTYVYASSANGAFSFGVTSGHPGGGSGSSSWGELIFNASSSNSTYGNSTTVQPESHDWIICAVAFSTATNVGSVDVANVMSAVGQVQANPNLQGAAHIVETWKSDDSTSWYRKWSDGWIEQGGFVKSPINAYDDGSAAPNVVNFFVPFKDTNYTVITTAQYPDINWGNPAVKPYYRQVYAWGSITNKTSKANFTISNICDHMWYACGY